MGVAAEAPGEAGLRGLGATEASERVLRVFRSRVESSQSLWELLEALDYLASSLSRRPFSALLLNTARSVLEAVASGGWQSLEELRSLLTARVDEMLARVVAETEAAAEIAARRLEPRDVVLTYSYSRSVLRALEKAAAMGKEPRVIVAESRPLQEGLEMAKRLARSEIKVTLIVDSAVRFLAREATRVLLGADAVTADGSIVARTGSGMVALAASEARVRVTVVAGTYKLYPETVYGLTIETPWLGDEIVPEQLRSLDVKGYAPLYETVPPSLVDALATEKGVIAPEAVPLLIREAYGEWPPRIRGLEELQREARERILEAIQEERRG
ncbi:MAG: translation initiation factor eIF-2B [Crenarchaeota archaeon]|nr:translation initiation factor eIF-2B [Thermoproteota archaeon]